jgi:radical SAM superfamily enzyme YgiQ (UPF0313 family)
MGKQRIGILELIGPKAYNRWVRIDDFLAKKQYTALTPQAISVWCRQMGHSVQYATYFGFGDPKAKLPNDLDTVFIAAHTPLAPLAYALSKLYHVEGTRTVIGGPHAKCFPQDCQRYFDLVVLECDKDLITDIVSDQFKPGSIISSQNAYNEPPTVEERLPEIKVSTFLNGNPYLGSVIPMLASVGCPYTCNFCTDWNNRYRALSTDRLEEDLRFVSRNFPGIKLGFHDPNFGVRFDETMSVFERLPQNERNPYIIESSLTNLNPKRLERLRDTKCLAVLPGIESWTQYSNKAGVGTAINTEKLERVVKHLQILHEYVPYLQVNFILGLDTDVGDEPFGLTKEFVLRTPFVWPYFNIPMAFGGTPLYDTFLKEGRILRTMPFSFYTMPYLTLILKNYDPITYFQKMVDLHEGATSNKLLMMRLKTSRSMVLKGAQFYRSYMAKRRIPAFKETLHRLRTDRHFLTFHTGDTDILPEVYADTYQRQLGKYAGLLPIEESPPLLSADPVSPIIPNASAASTDQPMPRR